MKEPSPAFITTRTPTSRLVSMSSSLLQLRPVLAWKGRRGVCCGGGDLINIADFSPLSLLQLLSHSSLGVTCDLSQQVMWGCENVQGRQSAKGKTTRFLSLAPGMGDFRPLSLGAFGFPGGSYAPPAARGCLQGCWLPLGVNLWGNSFYHNPKPPFPKYVCGPRKLPPLYAWKHSFLSPIWDHGRHT